MGRCRSHLATRYIHGSLTLTLTHNLWSAFWLDPMLALLILLGFHLVVKRPLLALAPPALAAASWPSPAGVYYWWRRTTPGQIEPGRYLPPAARYAVLAAVGLTGVVLAVAQLAGTEDELVGELVIRLALTGLATGVIFALTCYVVGWHVLRWRRPAHRGAPTG